MSHLTWICLACIALSFQAAASAQPDSFALWQRGALRGANVMQAQCTLEDLRVLRSWGANLAEIPVLNVYDPNPPYAFQPGNLAKLDQAVSAAERVGLYVVLTCREGPGRADFNESYEIWRGLAAQDAYVRMWRQLAEHYRGRASIVGYDLMCEPHPDKEADQPLGDWNALAKRITAAIRTVDDHTPILINSIGWGYPQRFDVLEPTGDPRTVYVAHFYDPHYYTHQKPGDARAYPGFRLPGEQDLVWDKAAIEARLAPVRAFQQKHGVPIFVGEFGCARYAPGADRWLRDQTELYERYGWSWAYWAFREWDVMNIERTADPEDQEDHPDAPLLQLFKGYFTKNEDFPKPGAASDTAGTPSAVGDSFRPLTLHSRITHVEPMTGIVMWEDSENSHTDAIALEYSYLRYDDVVKGRGQYDWSIVERKLDSIAGRGHQAVLRFYETWPGRQTTVPEYIKALPDYHETQARSEGRDTGFPDWSHPEYQRFFLEFYEQFAAKYDRDPRLAFLEVGFGLWAEYHIYSGPEELGRTFPSKEFQAQFFHHLTSVFKATPWMISQDAHEASRTPFAAQRDLLDLDFGIFDDSFHLAWEPGYNLEGWESFGRDRWKRSPCGGEILFPNRQREEQVAAAWAKEAANFHITFMICEQWPRWTTMERIREHGLACGYKLRVTAFEGSDTAAYVTVANTGVAPIYYEAFVAVNGVRAQDSLKGLLPGEERRFTVASGGRNPKLTIECDRLVPGQRIEFEADLDAMGGPKELA
jgi:hypothetical protein